MANTAFTDYVLTGEANEIKSLYDTMVGIQQRGKSTTSDYYYWLGDLVTALGGDWQHIYCRGEWSNLQLVSNTQLALSTETAWGPMNEVFDFIRQRFPSIRYYFQSEEEGCELFWFNDADGEFFPDRYILDVCTPDNEYLREYFSTDAEAFQVLSEMAHRSITSEAEVTALAEEWESLSDDAYCSFHQFQLVD